MVLRKVPHSLSLLMITLRVLQVQGAIFQGPSDVIYFPGQGPVELTCNITGTAGWRVNGSTPLTLGVIDNGGLPGHSRSGTNLVVNVPQNNTEYICVSITNDGDIPSDPAFLYIAGVPNMVTGVSVSNNMVNVDETNRLRTFTLNWLIPFDNFDPILNFTINTTCNDNAVCPSTNVTGGDVTTIDISYPFPAGTNIVNYTIMITADNSIGSSIPEMLILAGPSTIQNVTVMCRPDDLVNLCNVTWNPLAYGPGAVQLPITYTARFSGAGVTGGMVSEDDVNSLTFEHQPADATVIVSVEAENALGSSGTSVSAEDDIMASAVLGTSATLLDVNVPADTYSLRFECTTRPNSTADYCEVMARNSENTVSASAPINENNTAMVIVSGLVCEQTYTIVAGGIVNQTLVGPRIAHSEPVTAPSCPVMTTTTMTMTTAAAPVTVTTTPTRTPTPSGGGGGGDDDDNTGLIVGVIVAVLAVVLIIAIVVGVVIYCYWCKDRESGSRTMSPSGDKLPVTSAGAGAGAGRPTSVRVQTLDRYGKPMTDESDGGNVELTEYKPVTSPEFTVNQMPSGNNQLTTKEESRTPSSYMPEGSYDTLAPADEPQGQSAPLTQNGQDQPQKGKLNYAELEQFSRKPASVKKPETQPPSQYAVIDPKSLQGTYT